MIIIGILLLLLSLLAMSQTLKIWNHQTSYYDRYPSDYTWSECTWWARIKIMPFAPFVMGQMAVALIISSFFDEDSNAIVILGIITLSLLSLLVILGSLFWLWNWPRFLVAPWLRDKPGKFR